MKFAIFFRDTQKPNLSNFFHSITTKIIPPVEIGQVCNMYFMTWETDQIVIYVHMYL